MLDTKAGVSLESRWDDARAAGMSEPELLLYRSNLLGADKRITNYGGGNTSAKVTETDPLTGEPVEVLWVKGSGGDVGIMKLDGFSTLYMEKLEALKGLYRGLEHEDEMVGYLPHCTFNLNPRAASIDTPLHAYRPAPACRSHACRRDHRHRRRRRTRASSPAKIFGDEIGWLPWKRPGYELGLWLEKFCQRQPAGQGRGPRKPRPLHLGRRPQGMLRDHARVINQAIDWLDAKTAGKPAFGGAGAPAAAAPPSAGASPPR